ncbi:MAG: adaptor protein MecA [Lachnospiraceae bacterium]|nr:adaptor protein MecA [Lachnospiraceae bacterium]
MKIERINENQIRCTLNHFDLSVRNLNLSELAYGSEKAKNLFREMIQKASNEVGFEADDIPLMVEAIPLSNESVMLVITKMEDPEELDTRFAKFSPMSDDEDSLLNDLASELLEGADGLMQYLKAAQTPSSLMDAGPETDLSGCAPTQTETEAESASPQNSIRIFSFSSLDLASDAAKVVEPSFTGESVLYKKPNSSQYFLVVKRSSDSLAFSRICNILAEYGNKIHHDYATEAYYEEHYETIIRQNAIASLALL